MLDEETVEYGVCLILAAMVKQTLPCVWDEEFRASKDKEALGTSHVLADCSLEINRVPWLTLL